MAIISNGNRLALHDIFILLMFFFVVISYKQNIINKYNEIENDISLNNYKEEIFSKPTEIKKETTTKDNTTQIAMDKSINFMTCFSDIESHYAKSGIMPDIENISSCQDTIYTNCWSIQGYEDGKLDIKETYNNAICQDIKSLHILDDYIKIHQLSINKDVEEHIINLAKELISCITDIGSDYENSGEMKFVGDISTCKVADGEGCWSITSYIDGSLKVLDSNSDNLLCQSTNKLLKEKGYLKTYQFEKPKEKLTNIQPTKLHNQAPLKENMRILTPPDSGSDVISVLIKGNSEECEVSMTPPQDVVDTTCVRLTNSKGIKIVCTPKKRICKTQAEVFKFIQHNL